MQLVVKDSRRQNGRRRGGGVKLSVNKKNQEGDVLL